MYQEIPNFARGLKCQVCKFPLMGFSGGQLLNYLRGNANACSSCTGNLDVFKILQSCIEENFFLDDVFTFVGARQTFGQFVLNRDKPVQLKFEDYGVPTGARILSMNYTPQGGSLFPVEMHSNTPRRLAPKDFVTVYPAKFGPEEVESVSCAISFTWVESGSLEDVSLLSLANAFEEYSNDDLVSCVVPANTSIEFDVMQVVEASLEGVTSKTNVKEFLRSGVSYVPSLKVMIPLFAKLKGIPVMPEELLASLVRLASLRNQIAHTGKTKVPPEKSEIATCLAGVVLGKWYVSLLRN